MIHPTAIIHPQAQLHDTVDVGAYAYIGPNVVLGEHCVVEHHATIDGHSTFGCGNYFYPYCFIGAQTHDLKYKGGTCYLKVGDRNVFREYVSVHTATGDGDSTVIGNDNYILAFTHIGHDSFLGNYNILSAKIAIAGHVKIGNHTNIGGHASIHQFCRIGDYAMLGAHSYLKKDLAPFLLACGNPAVAKSFNRIGMARKGFREDERNVVNHIFKYLYNANLNRSQALEKIQSELEADKYPRIAEIFWSFVRQSSVRGLL